MYLPPCFCFVFVITVKLFKSGQHAAFIGLVMVARHVFGEIPLRYVLWWNVFFVFCFLAFDLKLNWSTLIFLPVFLFVFFTDKLFKFVQHITFIGLVMVAHVFGEIPLRRVVVNLNMYLIYNVFFAFYLWSKVKYDQHYHKNCLRAFILFESSHVIFGWGHIGKLFLLTFYLQTEFTF